MDSTNFCFLQEYLRVLLFASIRLREGTGLDHSVAAAPPESFSHGRRKEAVRPDGRPVGKILATKDLDDREGTCLQLSWDEAGQYELLLHMQKTITPA